MKPTVLLVGGYGFLGSKLLESNQSKVIFKRQPKGSWDFSEVQSGFKSVVFLRSISSPTYVQQNEVESRLLNVERTSNFIRSCVDANIQVIFTSSDVIYGNTGDLIANEKTPSNPFGLYAQQKSEIEKSALDSPNFTSLRLSILTGHGSKLRKILESEKKPAIADGFIRSPINSQHVVDLISLLCSDKKLRETHRILNVGGQEHMSIFDLANYESKLLKLNKPIRVPPTDLDLQSRPRVVKINSNIAEQMLGRSFGYK
jgi:dTDP-4-dehydrorhamnose reductase